jgi:hypothetical protein
VMKGGGKSDRPVGTEEPFEQRQVRVRLAEEGEGRGLTEGNPFRPNKHRTQCRARGQHGEP